MTTGTAIFYKMKGSLSSGEYPLFTTGQDITSYQIHSVSVKYAKGLQTRLTVPIFEGYDTVNIAKLDGSYYWVTAFRESTTYNGSVEFTLDYAAPTSWFTVGTSIKGVWKRTPSNVCAYLQDQITNGVMGSSRTVSLSALDCPKSTTYLETYWIQVTGHDNNGNTKMFGGFIGYNPNQEDFDWQNGIYAIKDNNNGVGNYAPFGRWMNDLHTLTGLTSEDVDDMSISKRCPYKVHTYTFSTTFKALCLETVGSSLVLPILVNDVYIFDLTAEFLAGTSPLANTTTQTITLSTNERRAGHIALRDWNKNSIMLIDASRSATITVNARVHSGVNGIYTLISAFDETISVPEGKIPYYGNSASIYKAYSMDSDRMAMQNAVQTAIYNRETADMTTISNTVGGALSGLTMGALTGNPITAISGTLSGVASGISSAIDSERAFNLSVTQAQNNYELAKKRAIDQPTSGYNVAYGTIYAFLNEINPMVIDVRLPVNIASTYYTSWADNFGYPAEGEQTLTASNGFYQGKLLSDSTDKSGMYWDELNKTFMQGFKFITP